MSTIIGSFYLWTYLKTRKLAVVTDPVKFAKELDPKGMETEELVISNPGFAFDGGRVVNSSLFPYREIETISIEAYECPHRSIDLDFQWNVFWVEIAKCGPRTEFFGPYRSSTSLKKLYSNYQTE